MSALSTPLALDKSQNAAVNLAVLRRVDVDVEEILASSNYCAVYQHDDVNNTWVRFCFMRLPPCPPICPAPGITQRLPSSSPPPYSH